MWTKPSDFQIEGYSATSFDISSTAAAYPYTLTPWSSFVSIDVSAGAMAGPALRFKKGCAVGGKAAELKVDCVPAKK